MLWNGDAHDEVWKQAATKTLMRLLWENIEIYLYKGMVIGIFLYFVITLYSSIILYVYNAIIIDLFVYMLISLLFYIKCCNKVE